MPVAAYYYAAAARPPQAAELTRNLSRKLQPFFFYQIQDQNLDPGPGLGPTVLSHWQLEFQVRNLNCHHGHPTLSPTRSHVTRGHCGRTKLLKHLLVAALIVRSRSQNLKQLSLDQVSSISSSIIDSEPTPGRRVRVGTSDWQVSSRHIFVQKSLISQEGLQDSIYSS